MSNVFDLKANAKCVICQNVWIDPQVVNCSHIFCTQCLDTLTANHDVKCPLCNALILFRMKLPQLACLSNTINNYVEEVKPVCVQSRRNDEYLVCWMPTWKNRHSFGAYLYLIENITSVRLPKEAIDPLLEDGIADKVLLELVLLFLMMTLNKCKLRELST